MADGFRQSGRSVAQGSQTEHDMTRTSIFQAIRGREETRAAAPQQDSLPSYKPTYAEKLRLVGMHLDRNDMHGAKILDVPGGMLVRVVGSDRATEELLEFPNDTFPTLYEDAAEQRGVGDPDSIMRIKSEVIPTSYADVLRTLGSRLDSCAARSILISEGATSLFISGMRLENNSLRSTLAPFDEVLFPDDIDQMLTEAFRHRGISA